MNRRIPEPTDPLDRRAYAVSNLAHPYNWRAGEERQARHEEVWSEQDGRYVNHDVWLKQRPKGTEVTLTRPNTNTPWRLGLISDDGFAKVKSVGPGPATGKLRPGDEIIRINGTHVDNLLAHEPAEMIGSSLSVRLGIIRCITADSLRGPLNAAERATRKRDYPAVVKAISAARAAAGFNDLASSRARQMTL